MINVTERALEHLAEARSRVEPPTDAASCFRLAPNEKGQMRLTLDRPLADDRTFAHQGEVILAVSEELSQELDGRTLDTSESGALALT